MASGRLKATCLTGGSAEQRLRAGAAWAHGGARDAAWAARPPPSAAPSSPDPSPLTRQPQSSRITHPFPLPFTFWLRLTWPELTPQTPLPEATPVFPAPPPSAALQVAKPRAGLLLGRWAGGLPPPRLQPLTWSRRGFPSQAQVHTTPENSWGSLGRTRPEMHLER